MLNRGPIGLDRLCNPPKVFASRRVLIGMPKVLPRKDDIATTVALFPGNVNLEELVVDQKCAGGFDIESVNVTPGRAEITVRRTPKRIPPKLHVQRKRGGVRTRFRAARVEYGTEPFVALFHAIQYG